MVIDFDVRYKKLGVDLGGRRIIKKHLNDLLWDIPDTKEAFINAYLSLPPDELQALIRVEKLHERYPDYFTYDGPTGKKPE